LRKFRPPDLPVPVHALQSKNGKTYMTNAIFARYGIYFAAAGFQMRRADTPELVRNLESMPPFKLVARGRGGDVVYTYADPVSCRCLYVSRPKEFVEYQRLATERQVEEGQLWAESDGMDWGLWGGGWWLR